LVGADPIQAGSGEDNDGRAEIRKFERVSLAQADGNVVLQNATQLAQS
jgi:hypothetical protein